MTNDMDTSEDSGKEQVKSISTLFSILEHLKENREMGVTELAKEMDMSKGAVHRYLQTLVSEGYAVNNDGTYKLTMRFLDFGAHVRYGYPYNEYIKPKIYQLAEETGERAQYIIEEHGLGIYLHREQGANGVETDARVGKVVNLHTTAAGKAILAELSRDRVDEIIDMHGLVTNTEETISDRETLYKELAETQKRGYAFNQEEHAKGLYAIGVPIKDLNGKILGGISVSGPVHRIESQNDMIQQTLLGIKDEIELNLNYS